MISISRVDLKDESLHYEYKRAKGGLPKSFWETYSAFANSDGGYIFLGIEEKEKIKYAPVELNKDEINDLKEQLFSLANNKEKVSFNLLSDEDVEEIEVDGLIVLRVHINRCPVEFRPVFINNNLFQGTYRRNADGDYHCSIDEIKAMLRDANIKGQDLVILEDYSINTLDEETINQYRNIFAAHHPTHPFLKESKAKFLEFIGAAKLAKDGISYHPTAAGLLMFGFSYRIVYEFPNYFLDYQQIDEIDQNRWADRLQSDSGEWNGNLFTFFQKVVSKISSNLKIPFQMNGIYRNDDDVMHKAIREALCNALCNADYRLIKGVVVKQYLDRIVFKNPGCLMMDVDQMIKGGTSAPRNNTLLKMFNLIGIGEKSGSGVSTLFATSKAYKLPLPIIEEQYNPDSSTLVFYTSNPRKNNNNLLELEQDILNFVIDNGPSSAKEISQRLQNNITTIKLRLYHLVELGLINTSGTIKDKRYFASK